MKNSSLPLRLISLFHFLSANRQYNQNLQLKFYKATLLPYETKPEKDPSPAVQYCLIPSRSRILTS